MNTSSTCVKRWCVRYTNALKTPHNHHCSESQCNQYETRVASLSTYPVSFRRARTDVSTQRVPGRKGNIWLRDLVACLALPGNAEPERTFDWYPRFTCPIPTSRLRGPLLVADRAYGGGRRSGACAGLMTSAQLHPLVGSGHMWKMRAGRFLETRLPFCFMHAKSCWSNTARVSCSWLAPITARRSRISVITGVSVRFFGAANVGSRSCPVTAVLSLNFVNLYSHQK